MTSAPPRPAASGSRVLPSGGGGSYSMLPPVPAPLQRLFDYFPLRTLPANALPAGSPPPATASRPALYVFTTDADAATGAPSFNPSCLKWQTYLRLSAVPHVTVPSTNHASPSGALPFLIVAPEQSTSKPSSQQQQQAKYITTSTLPAYIASHTSTPPQQQQPPSADPDPRPTFYTTLLDTAVRPAYLNALYVDPSNEPLMRALYVDPATRSAPVRYSLARQLRSAAEAEVRRALVAAGSSPLDAEDPAALLASARRAFAALAELLLAPPPEEGAGDSSSSSGWFFGAREPGLFDASVFAYTHLLLSPDLAWGDRALGEVVEEFPALVEHRRRVYDACWGARDTGRGQAGAGESVSWEKV